MRNPPTYLVAVAGGNIYRGVTAGQMDLAANGANALTDTEQTDFVAGPPSPHDASETARFQWHVYFVDGKTYKRLNAHTNTVLDWEAYNGPDRFNEQSIRGVIPFSSDITLQIIDDSGGHPVLDGDHTADFPDGSEAVIQNFGIGEDGSYTVVSTSFAGGKTTVTLDPNPGLVSASTLQASLSHVVGRATLVALYRDRIVLSGFAHEPTSWYMSAVGDPLNWDFGPEISGLSTAAVAGPLTDAGRTGDAITALIPVGEDNLVFGAIGSLWVMRGDPAVGGTLEAISRSVGVSGRQAWTQDDSGTTYFFSRDGLYRLDRAASFVERIGIGLLDKTFEDINTNEFEAVLEYDRDRELVLMFFVDPDGNNPDPRSYAYDVKTSSLWPIKLPEGTTPTATHFYVHPDKEVSRLILGGRDGFVRSFFDDAFSDDVNAEPQEVPISSSVAIGPVTPFGTGTRWAILDTSIVLGVGSSPVKIRVYSGPTAERAVKETNPKAVLSSSPSTSRHFRQRISGESVLFEVSNDVLGTSWSFESMSTVGHSLGRERRQ